MAQITLGMNVKTEFGTASLKGLQVTQAELQRRRNGATGTVDSVIANMNGEGFWVVLDGPSAPAFRSRQMQAEDDAAVQDSIDRRHARAPFWKSELSIP